MNKNPVLQWSVAVVVLVILYQYKPLRGPVMGLGVLVVLGMLLKNYTNIKSSFQSIGL